MTESQAQEILENEEIQQDITENTDNIADSSAKIAELEAQNAELKDKMMRALAEAENTRKRVLKDKEDASKFAIAKFARDMIGVADNLGRALDAVNKDKLAEDAELKALHEGILATERELLNRFTSYGIKKLEPLDKIFDPNFHEVMFEAPIPNKAAGTVIQVMEEGYIIHDRLLRPAKVGVAKSTDGASDSTEGSIIDQEV